MMTSAEKRRLAALVSYVRLRDRDAAADEQTLLEILATASVSYQAQTSKPLLNVDLQMVPEGLRSAEISEALSLPAQDAGPDLSSIDAAALQILEEVLTSSPEQRRAPAAYPLPMTEPEVADTEAWMQRLQGRRAKQSASPVAPL